MPNPQGYGGMVSYPHLLHLFRFLLLQNSSTPPHLLVICMPMSPLPLVLSPFICSFFLDSLTCRQLASRLTLVVDTYILLIAAFSHSSLFHWAAVLLPGGFSVIHVICTIVNTRGFFLSAFFVLSLADGVFVRLHSCGAGIFSGFLLDPT
jgi:hypothetical protein